MTATILYKPIGAGTSLDVGGSPSSFINNIQKVFGGFPYKFDSSDIDKLQVLADLYDNDNEYPYKELIEAIEKSGVVEVYAMY